MLITYGDPDKIQFCHLSVRFRKAWPNRRCLGPPPDPLSRPFASLNLSSDNCSHRQSPLALSGEALRRLSSTQNLCIWYNWEQNNYRDERILMNWSMLFSEAEMTGCLGWNFCTLILSPLLKTTFILVGSDKKQIAVTSLWNRSPDTMGKRSEGNNRLVAVPLALSYHTPIFSSFFCFYPRSTGQNRVGRLWCYQGRPCQWRHRWTLLELSLLLTQVAMTSCVRLNGLPGWCEDLWTN